MAEGARHVAREANITKLKTKLERVRCECLAPAGCHQGYTIDSLKAIMRHNVGQDNLLMGNLAASSCPKLQVMLSLLPTPLPPAPLPPAPQAMLSLTTLELQSELAMSKKPFSAGAFTSMPVNLGNVAYTQATAVGKPPGPEDSFYTSYARGGGGAVGGPVLPGQAMFSSKHPGTPAPPWGHEVVAAAPSPTPPPNLFSRPAPGVKMPTANSTAKRPPPGGWAFGEAHTPAAVAAAASAAANSAYGSSKASSKQAASHASTSEAKVTTSAAPTASTFVPTPRQGSSSFSGVKPEPTSTAPTASTFVPTPGQGSSSFYRSFLPPRGALLCSMCLQEITPSEKALSRCTMCGVSIHDFCLEACALQPETKHQLDWACPSCKEPVLDARRSVTPVDAFMSAPPPPLHDDASKVEDQASCIDLCSSSEEQMCTQTSWEQDGGTSDSDGSNEFCSQFLAAAQSRISKGANVKKARKQHSNLSYSPPSPFLHTPIPP